MICPPRFGPVLRLRSCGARGQLLGCLPRCLPRRTPSCFGSDTWPADVPELQTWMEFDVEDIEAATEELTARGHKTLVANRTEPWGQIVTRLLSPEGILVGLTVTPWMRKPEGEPIAS